VLSRLVLPPFPPSSLPSFFHCPSSPLRCPSVLPSLSPPPLPPPPPLIVLLSFFAVLPSYLPSMSFLPYRMHRGSPSQAPPQHRWRFTM
jgi:hypothetical protein